MKRIIVHWTAGGYHPNNTDMKHYHFLINGDGLIIKGKYKPEDNENCSDNKYAQHTGGGNTGSIGVSYCGMLGYISGKPESTKYPLKRLQVEAGFYQIAKLCKQYNIPIKKDTVLTHYEFGKTHPKTTSAGKIDITYLHPYPVYKPNDVGDLIRNKVGWYLELINKVEKENGI